MSQSIKFTNHEVKICGKTDSFFQPKIEKLLVSLSPDEQPPEDLSEKLLPFRIQRKKLATICLFLVITAIILGVQTYTRFHPFVSIALIFFAAGFSIRANKSLIRFGWF